MRSETRFRNALVILVALSSFLAPPTAKASPQEKLDATITTVDKKKVKLSGKIEMEWDFTGGQIKDAIERGEKHVTIDFSKIPANPTPYLIATALDRRSKSGMYWGKQQVGDIVGVVTKKGRIYTACRLTAPVAFNAPFNQDTSLLKEAERELGLLNTYVLTRRDSSSWQIEPGGSVWILLTSDLKNGSLLIYPNDVEDAMKKQ